VNKIHKAALAALFILSVPGGRAAAAVPGLISYQGTLRSNGALVTDTVSMEFRITNADGSVVYWTSNSTMVPVAVGLFRYTLGAPNAAQFAAIPWKDITPYVQMLVEGNPFPREPLFAYPYAMHAYTAERSTGTFTAYDGDIRISTSAGSRGLVFQDGTAQYTAAGWSVSGQNAVMTAAGSAGIGVASPQARLDVQAASAAVPVQAWRDASGVIRSSITAAGSLHAAGLQLNDADANTATSGVRFNNFSCPGTAKLTVDVSGNLVCATDQTGGGGGGGGSAATIADALLNGNNAGGLGIINLGNTSFGPAAAETRLDVQAGGDGYAQFWRASDGVIVSSMDALGVLYADGSGLRNLPAGADSLGSHVATTTLNMAGFDITAVSTVAATRQLGAPALALDAAVRLSSASAANNGGVYVSTHVYLPAGARYYGDGSGLTALNASAAASGTLPDGRLSSNVALRGAANTFTSSFTVTSSSGAALAAVQFAPSVAISSSSPAYNGGVYVSSNVFVVGVASATRFYGDGSALTGISASDNFGSHTATQAVNMAGFRVNNAAAYNLNPRVELSSTTAANYGGVYISTHVFLPAGAKYYGDGSALTNVVSNVVDTLSATLGAGNDAGGASIVGAGAVAVGRASAGAPLDVQASGADAQYWRSGAGTVTSSMSASGVIYADGSALRNMGAYPKLAADQTFSGANTFSAPGQFTALNPAAAGLTVSSGLVVTNGSVGIGVAVPQERLDVSGAIKIGDAFGTQPGTLRFSGGAFQGRTGAGWIGLGGSLVYDSTAAWAVGPTTVYTVGASSNVAIGVSNSDFSKLLVHGAGNNQFSNSLLAENSDSVQLFVVRNDGNVGVGSYANPAARLDVQGPSGGYAQIWRDQFGVETASLTASGLLYADAANLRNLPSGADGMGAHTASQDLQMSGFRVKNASALNLNPKVELSSTAAANYGGVYISTHVFLPAGAKYYGDGSALTGVNGNDNLGNHTLAQNLRTGAYWVSGDGDSEGLYVSGNGNVGVGSSSPQEKLEVAGGIRLGDTSGTAAGTIRFSGGAFQGYTGSSWAELGGSIVYDNTALWAVGPTTVYTLGSSSNVAIGTSNSPSSKLLVRGAGNTSASSAFLAENSDSIQLLLVRNDGSVAVGPVASPGARLDVQGPAAGWTQVWRDQFGVAVASINAAGQFFADAANLRNLPSGADGMGTHTASQDLEMAGFRVKNASALNLNPKVELSSTAAANYGGVYISTHVFLPAGAKYYGDGSELTGIVGAAGMGNHTATKDLNMDGFAIVAASSITVSSITAAGDGVTISTHLLVMGGRLGVNTADPQASLHVNGGIISSSLSGFGTRCVHVDNNGVLSLTGSDCGTVAGNDNMGDHTMTANLKAGAFWISGDGGNEGLTVSASGDVGVGRSGAASRLDVQGSLGGYSQIWRNHLGVEVASITTSGFLYADASNLRNLPAAPISPISSVLAAGNNAGAVAILNTGNIAAGRAGAAARLDVKTNGADPVSQIWRNSSDAVVSSMSSTGVLYANASGLRGLSLPMVLAGGNDAGGTGAVNLGRVAIGGLGAASPLDVRAAGGDQYVQIWRNSAGVEIASFSAVGNGPLYADGSQLRNLPVGGLATLPLDMGFKDISNVAKLTVNDDLTVNNALLTLNSAPLVMDNASLTLNNAPLTLNGSPLTVYSSGTFTGPLGVGAARLAMTPGVEISSTAALFHGGIGVRVSTNVFIVGIASATKFYGDGSGLTNLPGGGGGNVVDTLSDTLTAGNNAGGNTVTNLGGLQVTGAAGVTAPALNLGGNIAVSTTTAGNDGGVYVSTHVRLAAGAKFYGDGSGLTNLPGSGGTVTNPLGANLNANSYDLTNVSTISAASVLRINGNIKAAVLAGTGNRCVYVDANGVLQAKTEDCGTGGGGGGAESCVNPNDAGDVLVAVGDFCVDKYEATVWSTPTGGTKYGTGVNPDNYPCSKNGQNCSTAGTKIYARSVPAEVPSSSMTWFQANAACINAGKHLITNAEWQSAVIGTPDPGDRGGPPGAITPSNPPNCNAGTSAPTMTGDGTNCLSAFGAENMVGSLWEWVSDWGQYSSQSIFWPDVGGATYHGDVAQGGAPGPTTAIGGMIRGGAYDSVYTVAGPYAFSTLIPPYGSAATLGFRCAMRLR
jgi:formylglycine-generating enzyme required for sulfatase activity